MKNNRRLGTQKEQEAGRFLEAQGYRILEYNFYSQGGEIDIVAKDGTYLVFVEVKYRSSRRNGLPEDSVTMKKAKKIMYTAQYYLYSRNIPEDTPCRFDVVTILERECNLIRDAFQL